MHFNLEDFFVQLPSPTASEAHTYPAGPKTLLEELFTQPPGEIRIFNTLGSGEFRQLVREDYTILLYPLSQFSELKKYVNKHNLNPKRFRFVIDTNFHLWFAPEGVPNHKDIPAHFEMTKKERDEAQCYAAGTISLDDTQQTLVEISNKSGDFTPDCSCLELLLMTLFLHEENLPFKLSEQLSILKLNKKHIEMTHTIEMKDLKDWVTKRVDKKLLEHQPEIIVSHSRRANSHTLFFSKAEPQETPTPTTTSPIL